MKTTVVRAVTLPVARPVELTWPDLNAALTPCFRLATELANWCVRRLFVLDAPGDKTPETVRTWYGYRDAVDHYPGAKDWAGAMASLNIVTRTAQRKYVQQRFAVMVRHESSLLTYRYPQPYPVHNQNWSLTWKPGERPVVSLPLPGIGRVALELLATGAYRRQLAMLRGFLDGTVEKGEAAVMKDRKGQLMVKLVGHFPRREPDAAPVNACFLHTDPNAFLVAEVNGRSVAITNGDHIRRAVAIHKAFLQRAAEDRKREVRMDRRQRKNFGAAVDARCGRQADRVKTAVHQLTAQVVRFCERQRVGVVVYDDADRGFIPEGFAWHAVGERLADKLDRAGITFLARNDLPQKEYDEWRSDPSLVRATALAGARLVRKSRRPGTHPCVTAPPRSRSTARK